MSDSDNLESDSDQPLAKKAKSNYDTLSSHQVNNNKKERQKRYREQNRDKLKQREAERRKRIQYSQSIAGPSSSSNTNRIELNNEEIITAQSSFSFEKTQLLSIQRNEQGNELNALQKKRERQRRYREQNRDELKQREAERRRRLQNAEMSENTTEIQNNYSQFRYHKSAHEYFNDNFKNNEFGHACSICDRLWFEKDLKKPSASGNIINTITYGQNVDTIKIIIIIIIIIINNVDVSHLPGVP